MADNKDLKDGRDRSKVDGNESYELQYIAGKFGVSVQEVKDTIDKVGNNRDDIERALNKGKNMD